ncbi:MAG: ATP-binding cassette domain-containing protein, partial [Desulfovibrio sp.]|nr:ATP-binding cassette domain-containing protein [Desulfovibrio sp.]
MALLVVSKLKVSYGSVEVLHGIDLAVEEGEIVTILGSNGAGKSTTLLTISGLVKAKSGKITFNGTDLSTLPSHAIVGRGISQSPEGRRVFATLTVLDNLKLGAYSVQNQAKSAKTLEWIFELFPRLEERQSQMAGTLSGGE